MRTLVAAALAVAATATANVDLRKRDWKLIGRAPATATKSFSVAMPMRDFPGLEKKLLEISDPYHPTYGQWLTWEEADAYTATPKAIKDEVYAWATSTGAQCEVLAESLRCVGTVASIESLLSTELSQYVHKTKGAKIIRSSAPATVPDSLIGKVVMVTGLKQFPVPRVGSVRPFEVITAVGDVDYSIVPQTLTALYNVTSVDGTTSSTQAPIEFQGYPAFVQSDLDTFLTSVGGKKFTIPASQIIGTFSADPAAESTLDEQYIGAVGAGNNNWYWTERWVVLVAALGRYRHRPGRPLSRLCLGRPLAHPQRLAVRVWPAPADPEAVPVCAVHELRLVSDVGAGVGRGRASTQRAGPHSRTRPRPTHAGTSWTSATSARVWHHVRISQCPRAVSSL